MYLLVHSIQSRTPLDTAEGKNLARLARECFFSHQPLILDFVNVELVTAHFCQALLCSLTNEFGADYLNQWLQIKNLSSHVRQIIQSAMGELDDYFDCLERAEAQSADQEITSLNCLWLIKARDLCRDNPLFAGFMLGISDKALIEAIGRLSIEDIEHIAQSGWLCFAPRISNHFFEYMNRKQHTAVDVLLTLREGLNHGG
jgi:hypothetical protein